MSAEHPYPQLRAEHGGSARVLDGDGAELPPGTMKYPECACAQHRAGKGRPDSSVRLRPDAASTPVGGAE
ncbi:hypothetical protein CD790_14860 [Streptomyces sp. SAJ15]|nr:hypothetical protein CD790_14860 [Streptomyces sp. SAJ15]